MSTVDQVALADAANPLHPHHHSWKKIALRIFLLLIAVGLIAVFYFYVLEPYMGQINEFLISLGPWAPVAYIAIFFIATMLFIPESVIAIAGGTLFGLWMGWVWVVVACCITAMITFAITRLFIRNRINNLLVRYPKAYAVEQATGRAGFKIMFLLRLAPVNFTLLNYLGSVSPCSFRAYALACLGMIPGNFSTVYMGYVARHSSDLARRIKNETDAGFTGSLSHELPAHDSLVHEITLYGGLVVAIVASVVVGRVAIKAIHKETQRQKALDEVETPSVAMGS